MTLFGVIIMSRKKLQYRLFILVSIILLISFNNLASAAGESIGVLINNQEIKQGGLLTISTKESEIIEKAVFNNVKYNFYPDKDTGGSICLIPVSYWCNTGIYRLEIIGDKVKILKEVQILPGGFVESRITVDSSQEEMVRPQNKETIARKERDNQLISKARSESNPEKLWQGNFIWPVEGTITTTFGATRYVNEILNNRHSGIDIAAPRGTEVKSAGDGIVKLSAELLVTGNTIIIDHGWNIFSSYSHLDNLNVNSGDIVKKGDIIGNLGSTGLSTGPHLHWAVTVHGVFVNPEVFMDN